MAVNNLKHIGQLVNTQRRCVVVFRELPDDDTHCLVVDTDALPDWMHDDVMNAVESPGGQSSTEFYDYASRILFTDGSNMLNALHNRNLLSKQATANVMMTPNREASIRLDELNKLVREANGDKPAVTPPTDQLGMAGKDVSEDVVTPVTNDQVQTSGDDALDNSALAATMLSQAEQFEAEAKNLREQAYEMNPELKPRRGRPAGSKNKNTQTAE